MSLKLGGNRTLNASKTTSQDLSLQLAFRKQVILLTIFSLFVLTTPGNTQTQINKRRHKFSLQKQERKEGDKKNFFEKTLQLILQNYEIEAFGSPHTINALPITYFDVRTGLNLGFRTLMLSKQKKPYLYRLTVQFIASFKGHHNHKLIFEYPEIGHSIFGFKLQGEWQRDLQARYFGIGNNSVYEKQLTDPKSAAFIDKDFYLYNLKQPRLTIFGSLRILPALHVWFGFGLQSVQPQLKNGPQTSYLALDRPFGYSGGAGKYLSFRLSWDTRATEIFPLTGFLTEFTFEPNFASVNTEIAGANGAESQSKKVTYYRYTFSDAYFIPITSERLILANRIAFEAIAGEAPYYAYGEIGGQRYTRTLGGSQSLRGFQTRRFQDKIKFFTLTEFRYNFKQFNFMSQSFDLILIGFFDSGRVWHRWSEIAVHNFHATFGTGLWLNWNNKLIFRLDVGRSTEEINAYFRLNSAF
ncbi:MAG: BamA/TamA family outer membrane protein [bacterium]